MTPVVSLRENMSEKEKEEEEEEQKEEEAMVKRARRKERGAGEPTDAFPRFFRRDMCPARKGERVEKFSCPGPAGWDDGGGAGRGSDGGKNDIQDSAAVIAARRERFHARSEG